MGKLKVNHQLINDNNAQDIIKLCPFGAISYTESKLDISSACKMCKICAKKSNGAIEYVEEEIASVDKSLWQGVCVYVDHCAGRIHRVTYELCGKAIELAKVTGQPVYALMIGDGIED